MLIVAEVARPVTTSFDPGKPSAGRNSADFEPR